MSIHYITLIFKFKIIISIHNNDKNFNNYLFFSDEFFKILVYHLKYDVDIHINRSCFIILLFQEEIIHQIISTCNVSFMFILHYMLASIFMLHYISGIKSYLQQQTTFDVRFFPNPVIAHIFCKLRSTFPTFMLALLGLYLSILIFIGKG